MRLFVNSSFAPLRPLWFVQKKFITLIAETIAFITFFLFPLPFSFFPLPSSFFLLPLAIAGARNQVK
jgi:hypothetical protein